MEIYIHIPFCRQKCRYCDFVSFPCMEDRSAEYVDLLLREAALRKDDFPSDVDTVFIGGGTPSLLAPDALRRLLDGLRDMFRFAPNTEITSECNPGTLTDAWLSSAVGSGINRISVGVQAAQNRLLKSIGRIHTIEDATDSVRMLRQAGIRNINLDLMFGLPGQTMADWQETLTFALNIDPEHLSCYGLIPEEGTPLYADLESGKIELPEVETERAMYDTMLRTLADAGYRQYEISNLAKPGYECRHNIGYWRQVPYLGLGLSASSMRRTGSGCFSIRERNTNVYNEYRTGIEQNDPRYDDIQTVSRADAMFETLMLGLRMNDGVTAEQFSKLHGISLDAVFGGRLKEQAEKGLIEYDGSRACLTRLGMDLQNQVLVDLMPD